MRTDPMLTQSQLTKLYRAHRQDRVLSVYLDADQHDFADRAKWRIALKNGVTAQRNELNESTDFDSALAHLEEVLETGGRDFLTGRGWVGFATAERRLYAEGVPVPMPDLVRWEDGLRVAPYARALKQSRPVVAALIDSRRARILRYRMGVLEETGQLEADTYLGDLTDINVAKRASGHSGVRGKTGTDAAKRFLDVERDRLVARVAEEIEADAGKDGFIVVGGAERAVGALREELDGVTERLTTETGLSFDLSDTELAAKVEGAATELSQRSQTSLVQDVIERARSGGQGCLGERDTERALLEGRVATLVVSDTLRREKPDRIDHFEGAAFEHAANVVEVSRDVAGTLDEEGGGIGALLRYRVRD